MLQEFYGAVAEEPEPGKKKSFNLAILVKKQQKLEIKSNAAGRLFLLVFM